MLIQSLGDLLDHGYAMDAYCGTCARGFLVDLHALAEALGRDHSHLSSPLPIKCDSCGNDDLVKLTGRE